MAERTATSVLTTVPREDLTPRDGSRPGRSVIVTTEARFRRSKSGWIGSPTGGRAYWFWDRYKTIFDEVTVLARVFEGQEDSLDAEEAAVEGPGVRVLPITPYAGIKGMILSGLSIRKDLAGVDELDAELIARVPGRIGTLAARRFVRKGKAYALEVVGDPTEVFSRGAFPHPLRPVLRIIAKRRLAELCSKAAAVAYVTERTLQERFPAPSAAYRTSYSSVELPPEAFVDERDVAIGEVTTLINVANQSQAYKGHDVLIEATQRLVANGARVRLVLVGSGSLTRSLKEQVSSRGLADVVDFVGQVSSGEGVRACLEEADLFVLPSRADALPRALLEAMAQGLPCIATAVGGVPELLDPRDLVPSGDPIALAAAIAEVIADHDRRREMSVRNLATAKRFHAAVLEERRNRFYAAVAALSSRDDDV